MNTCNSSCCLYWKCVDGEWQLWCYSCGARKPLAPRELTEERLYRELQEALEALRELHDFAVYDSHHRYVERSKQAFKRAAIVLNKYGH